MSDRCCLKGCNRAEHEPDVRVEVWPPSDAPPVVLWTHRGCFEDAKSPEVTPDSTRDRGRIPANARCVFCGDRLPFVGAHPYAIEVGEVDNSERFWIHAQCIESWFSGLPD
jgi:hypothetical protein